MIKAAIDRVLQLADPHIEHINGRVYSDKPMLSIDSELRATGIKMSSLSSLVNYIKSGLDRKESAYLVHVLSPTEVSLGLPSIETVTRLRRKVQAEHPEVRASEKVTQWREVKEKQARAGIFV